MNDARYFCHWQCERRLGGCGEDRHYSTDERTKVAEVERTMKGDAARHALDCSPHAVTVSMMIGGR